jgi:hypothetical protein
MVAVNEDGVLGGWEFNPPEDVLRTNVGFDEVIAAQPIRHIGVEVGLAYDRSGATDPARVYMVYTDEALDEGKDIDDTNIFVIFSDDNGTTWSHEEEYEPEPIEPVRVNDDFGEDETKRSQFFPRIAVDQKSGYVAVSWYDSRNDVGSTYPQDPPEPGNRKAIANNDTQFFASMSIDGGQSFLSNVPVSEGTSDECAADCGDDDIDYGDYTGLAFHDGYFFPAWADNSDCAGATDCDGVEGSDGDNPEGPTKFDIYTARVVPEPRQLLMLGSGVMALWGLSFLRARDRGLRRRLG